MSYQANKPPTSFESPKKDRFTGISGTTCSLTHAVSSVADILVWVNGVKQDFTNYSVSGSTLTLGGTLVSADIVEVTYVGRTYGSIVPSDASIVTSSLQDGAVTNVKLGSDINATKLTAGLVPTARLGSGTASSSTVLYGDQTFKTAPSGGLVPVKQSTGSSYVDNIIVNGWVSDTYENYIMYYDVTPATNGADIRMTLYNSSGNLSGSQYDYVHSGADANGGAYQQISAEGQTSFSIGNNVHNNSDRIGLSGYMIWKHPRIASKRSTFITHFKMLDNTPVLKHFDGAMDYKDATSLTGFYLNASSGQLKNWRIRCYGIVDS